MLRAIVGTAGHIDHGKTRLLLALTGIDCDRWAEEKARGITIDLGFAHLETDELQLGFIDVPGHERFLHNALAGLGGIRLMLLVVAADEGVKPQTREHLAICTLLGIPRGIVALTKCDLVEPDLAELARLEVEELLEGTPYEASPILRVSSLTGEGIDALRDTLVATAREAGGRELEERPFRLPVDRAFHLRGLGVVVTGTLISGRVAPGQTVSILPAGSTARVRSLQVHGSPREEARSGERTALQLSGVRLDAVGRGDQLATPGAFSAGRSLAVRLHLLPDAPEALDGPVPIRLHLASSEVVGRLRPLAGEPIEPGGSGLAEVRLARPVVAVRGDRFVVRRPSPPLTLGGGEVLDPRWRRRRGRGLASALGALGSERKALVLWAAEARERGSSADELAGRLGEPPDATAATLHAITEDGRLLEVGEGRKRRWIAPDAAQRVFARGRRVLSDFFSSDRLARGMPKAELLERVLPRRAADLADVYLRWLQAEGILEIGGDLVNLPGRRAELTGEESRLATRLLERMESADLTPPSPAELAAELEAKPQILEGVQRYLIERGRLIRLPTGLLISEDAVQRLRGALHAAGWEKFTVPEFKDRFGLSRKWAIPILEHLDSIGATRRLGDQRLLVKPPASKSA